MNRTSKPTRVSPPGNLPHTRGDEPNPHQIGKAPASHLPHTRGDEPDDDRALADVYAKHLPHTRGDEPLKTGDEDHDEPNLPHTRGDEPPFIISEWLRHLPHSHGNSCI